MENDPGEAHEIYPDAATLLRRVWVFVIRNHTIPVLKMR